MRQLVKETENSDFKPVKLRLKFDLVSYPARAEGLGKYGEHYDWEISIKNKEQYETGNKGIEKSLENTEL